MTATCIRKRNTLEPFYLYVDKYYLQPKFVKKAFYKNNDPVVYLFVLHRLVGNVQRFVTRAELLYDSLNPLFCDVFAAVVVCARSLLLWSIKSHDADLSLFFLLLYM